MSPKMDERKRDLLLRIVDNYIRFGQPVSSNTIAEARGASVSSATIRNEMVDLEQLGLIYQPHISAGRVPTEAGYRFYLESLSPKDLPLKLQQVLQLSWQGEGDTWHNRLKSLAKALSQVTSETIFIGFGPSDTYYTGMSQLVGKPEFRDQQMLSSLSETIDRLDSVMEQFFAFPDEGPLILLGAENPFSSQCSTIVMRYERDGVVGVLGLVGPMRMNYSQNIAALRVAINTLTALHKEESNKSTKKKK